MQRVNILWWFLGVFSFFAQAKKVPDGCRTVSIFIQHPCNASELGHVGMAVDDEYYDFGPYVRDLGLDSERQAKKISLYTIGTRGAAFYDQLYKTKKHPSATANDMRLYYSTRQSCPAYEFKARVTPREAFLVDYYWKWIYQNFPRFNVFGQHCTSVAIQSLQYAGLLEKGPLIKTPRKFQKRIEREMLSSCGEEEAGRPLIPTALR